MHSLQIRMTIAFTLVIGAATLASVAVEPTSKDRRADARKAVAPPATTQAVAPRERTPSGNSERAVAGPRIQAAAGLVVARDGRVRFDPRMIDALRSGDRLSLGWRPRSAPEQFEVIRYNRTSTAGCWWQLRSLERDLVVATLAQRDGLVAG